jgi:alkyldihydroxyacetonephosphate synthase
VRRERVFWGWGEPGAGPSLPEHARGFLCEELGVSGEVVARAGIMNPGKLTPPPAVR